MALDKEILLANDSARDLMFHYIQSNSYVYRDRSKAVVASAVSHYTLTSTGM